MHVHSELCLIPLDAGLSLTPYVARCQEIIEDAGLAHELHAYGTNIEGDWDAVMAAVKACHEAVHAMGAVRIHSSLKIGTRTDKSQSLGDKVASVQQQRNP